jgi:hypothetical protein
VHFKFSQSVCIVVTVFFSAQLAAQGVKTHPTPEAVIATLLVAAKSCDYTAVFALMPPPELNKYSNDERVGLVARSLAMESECRSGKGEWATGMRELEVMATLARDMSPVLEAKGTVAVYDLRDALVALGQKADQIRLVRYDNAWWMSMDQ